MNILPLKIVLSYVRFSPIIIYYYLFKNNEIDQDIKLWINKLGLHNKSKIYSLCYLLCLHKSFRNIFYLRFPKIPNFVRNAICPPDKTLYIANYYPEAFNEVAGGGIFIIHGFGTRIRARRIGYGCKFRQLTTIGSKSETRCLEVPTIGNNVDFGANVTCIGNVTIGNNVTIGAGSVVTKSIPDNAIVAGNPAKILKFK